MNISKASLSLLSTLLLFTQTHTLEAETLDEQKSSVVVFENLNQSDVFVSIEDGDLTIKNTQGTLLAKEDEWDSSDAGISYKETLLNRQLVLAKASNSTVKILKTETGNWYWISVDNAKYTDISKVPFMPYNIVFKNIRYPYDTSFFEVSAYERVIYRKPYYANATGIAMAEKFGDLKAQRDIYIRQKQEVHLIWSMPFSRALFGPKLDERGVPQFKLVPTSTNN
ncbi:MAG: hypothetical protein R3A80_08770 [Bdellovibrionota bacterium]